MPAGHPSAYGVQPLAVRYFVLPHVHVVVSAYPPLYAPETHVQIAFVVGVDGVLLNNGPVGHTLAFQHAVIGVMPVPAGESVLINLPAAQGVHVTSLVAFAGAA